MVTLLHDNGELHVEASRRPRRAGARRPLPRRRRHHRQGRREQQADRRAAGQQGAGVSQPRRRSGRELPQGRAQLHLRADPAQPARGRRARRRPQVQSRPRLRPQRQVLGIVASTIAQAVKIQRLVEEDKKRLVDENTHLRQELKRALRLLEHHRQQRPGAPDVRADGAGRGDQHDGAHPRRVGDRQGDGRARHPLQLAARQQAVRQGELRGAARQPDRVGAVRLREGRVHRRRAAEEGPLRAGRGRHAVPRRDRRHQPRRRR